MKARIEGPQYRDTFKLHVWSPIGPGRVTILMNDNTWQDIDELIVAPEGAGLELPYNVFDAVFEAFLDYRGIKTHDPTEVKVLREWLTVERARVQAFIDEISHKALS